MSMRDYYPAGAYYDSDAPYNQLAEGDYTIETTAVVAVTLRKDIVVEVINDDYQVLEDDYAKEHTSLPALLGELEKYIQGELQSDISEGRRRELGKMLDDCRGWSEDCTEIYDIEC